MIPRAGETAYIPNGNKTAKAQSVVKVRNDMLLVLFISLQTHKLMDANPKSPLKKDAPRRSMKRLVLPGVELYCGDCLEMPWIEADAVVSDPPYGIASATGRERAGARWERMEWLSSATKSPSIRAHGWDTRKSACGVRTTTPTGCRTRARGSSGTSAKASTRMTRRMGKRHGRTWEACCA